MDKNLILTTDEIKAAIHFLLNKYQAEYALLFGSYARGDATAASDIDVIVVGGENFRPSNIFAFGEDLRELIQRDVDIFEINEVDRDTSFYENVMREGIKIA